MAQDSQSPNFIVVDDETPVSLGVRVGIAVVLAMGALSASAIILALVWWMGAWGILIRLVPTPMGSIGGAALVSLVAAFGSTMFGVVLGVVGAGRDDGWPRMWCHRRWFAFLGFVCIGGAVLGHFAQLLINLPVMLMLGMLEARLATAIVVLLAWAMVMLGLAVIAWPGPLGGRFIAAVLGAYIVGVVAAALAGLAEVDRPFDMPGPWRTGNWGASVVFWGFVAPATLAVFLALSGSIQRLFAGPAGRRLATWTAMGLSVFLFVAGLSALDSFSRLILSAWVD